MDLDHAAVCHDLSWRIVGGAIQVHRELGPGLLESTYRRCLVEQLRADGMVADEEVPVPLIYRTISLDAAYRADLIVEGQVLLELKAVEALLPLHTVQILTYLRLTRLPLGLLINFNVPRLKDGIRRFANTHRTSELPDSAADRLPLPSRALGH